MDFEMIVKQAASAALELLEAARLREGDIFVVGCSTSEIAGGIIGKDSSLDAARAVHAGISAPLRERGIFLAAQCCEHLNRALIVERECAERYGLEIVAVLPQPKAGGAFATVTYEDFADPIAVEHIRAHAGIDIGDTLIGMHLRDVAVPVRLENNFIGSARVIAARTRPKYIGGERAKYN